MKLIVGLGNPGRKYEQTRHNAGFVVAAKIASLASASPSKVRFEGEFAEAIISGEKMCILWPQTFMNCSGQSVRKAVDFFKLELSDVLVVCDDLDLPVGRIRFKPGGSAGGQRGLANIIRHLASDEFPRLKIGIGRPPRGWDTADYVLGKFSTSEQTALEPITTTAANAAIQWVELGMGEAMSRYNHLGKPQKKSPTASKNAKSDTKTTKAKTLTGDPSRNPGPTPIPKESTESERRRELD